MKNSAPVLSLFATIAIVMTLEAPCLIAAGLPGWGWSEPGLVSLPNSLPRSVDLAGDAAGNAVAVWLQEREFMVNDVWTNRFVPGIGWGTPALLEDMDGSAGTPLVCSDPGGNFTVLWVQTSPSYDITSVWAVRRPAGAGWGPPEQLEVTFHTVAIYANAEALVADDRGAVTAVWARRDVSWELRAARYEPGTGWSTPMTISSVDQEPSWVRTGTDAAGNVLAVWSHFDDVRWNIWASRYTAGVGWGAAQLIELSDEYAGNPDIAVWRDGAAIAVWSKSNTTGSFVMWSTYTPAQGWQEPAVVDPEGYGSRPRIVADLEGNAHLIWAKGTSVSTTDLWTCRYTRGHGWSAPAMIETGADGGLLASYTYCYDLGVDAHGNAIAIWVQTNASIDDLWACRYTPAAGWGAPEVLEDYPSNAAYEPVLYVAPGGDALAVWEDFTSLGSVLLSCRYVAPDVFPPTIELLTPPNGFVTATATVAVMGVTEPGARLSVNGLLVELSSNGSFSVVIALLEGVNTITVIATDDAGNQGSVSVTVTYQPPDLGGRIDELERQLTGLQDALEDANASLGSLEDELDDANSRLNSVRTTAMAGLAIAAAALVGLGVGLYIGARGRRAHAEIPPPPPPSE
ncbi:MAG: hypothetical protein QXQ13_07740 [Thermoplasmata archaeon]